MLLWTEAATTGVLQKTVLKNFAVFTGISSIHSGGVSF